MYLFIVVSEKFNGINKTEGRTYYISSATNVGVYRYRNGLCTLIDTGLDNTTGRKITQVLENNNLKVKYIVNTHAHPDHFGANNFIKENILALS